MSKHEATKSKSEQKNSIEDRVRDRAYELYVERISVERDMYEGNAEEDWLRAEKELLELPKPAGKAA
jgi:hypothetical protein